MIQWITVLKKVIRQFFFAWALILTLLFNHYYLTTNY